MRVLALFGLFSLLAAFPPLPCLPMAGVPDMKRDRNEEEGALFEGDILLGPGEDIASKNLLLNPEIRWPNRTLYYEISDEYNEEQRSAIIRAISDLQKVTCVRLVPRTEDQQAYLVIRNVYGCASPVGFHRGRRELRLHFPGCFTRGTIQHEFFHALGFWHEHSRGDRDDYIRIMWENIRKGAEHNFVARAQSEVHLLGMPYDYNSVMHYRSTAFSKDGRSSTIVPLKPQVAIGQRLRYSKIDLAKLNRLYNCDGYYKGEDVPGARPAMPFTDKPAAQNPSENTGQNASTQSQSTQQYTTSPSTHGHSPTPNQQVQSTINQNPGQDNQNQSQNKQHQVNNQNQAHNKPNQTHNNHNQAQNAGYATVNSQVQSYPSRIQRHDSFHRPQSSSNDDIQFDSSSQYSNNERNQGNNYYGSQQNPQQYSSNSRRHNMNPNQQRNAEQFSNQQPYSNYGYQQQQSNQRGYGYGNQATNRYNNQPVNFQVKRSTNYARHMPQRNNNERGNYGGGHSSRRPQNQLRNNRGGCSSSENQNNDRGYTNEDYNNEEHQQEQNNNCRESSQSNNSGRRRNHGSSSSGRYPSRGHDQQYPNSRRNNSPQNSNRGQQYPRDNNHRKTSDSNSGYQYQQPESTNNNGGNSNNRNRQQHHQNESDMSEPTPSKEEERYHIKQEYFSGNQNTKNKDADLLSKVESEVGGSDE